MKFAILLVASTGVLAQLPGLANVAPGSFTDMESLMGKLGIKCLKEPLPEGLDPMRQFPPARVQWPCDFGKPVPYGKVPKGCAKYEVLVARGTSEIGPLGMVVGDPLVARVIKAMPGQNVRGYPVQYPAGNVMPGIPATGAGAASIASLLESLETGPKDVANRIASQLKQCPDSRFALVGYNQGATVLSMAATRLTPQQLGKVDAVVTYGADTAFPPALEKKWLNNCAPGDMCGGNKPKGNEAHLSYNNEGTAWHDRSAKYIADAFKGKSQGKISAKSPKK